MTTAMMTDSPAVYTPPNHRLSAAGLLRAEWTKFWSLRSTWIVLICAAVFGAGIGVAVAGTYSGGMGEVMQGAEVLGTTMFGVALSSVFIAVLGILFITGEYSTGSIRSTMAAAPKRTSVLWAKAGVFTAVVAVLYAAVVFATFALTQALLSGTDLGGVSISDPEVLRVLLGYVATVIYLGLLGVAVGSVIRNSAGAISVYIGGILIVPSLAPLLPWSWVPDVVRLAPGEVTNSLTSATVGGDMLSLSASWTWMGVWTVVLFGLAAVLLKRRDV